MSVVGMAVVFHFVHFIIGVAGIVHHHNDVVVKRTAHCFVVKLFRRIGFNGRNGLTILVLKGVLERLNGFAQGQGKHFIHRGKHLCLAFLYLCRLRFGSNHLAKFKPKLAQLRRNQLRHAARVLARIGFGHHAFGYKAIFFGQVGHATECSTIVKRMLKEELYFGVVDGFLGTIYHTLQHEVGFF